MHLIEIEDLRRTFGAVRALDGLTLRVREGEWLAVTGPSGSGKTTLLNLLAGLERASDGRIEVAGHDLAALDARALARFRRENVGLVFQDFHLVPYLDAVENVMLAQYVHSMADAAEAAAALDRVGLAHRRRHLPSQLSGGERQRLSIARALVNHPRLLLADEPTGNLDADNERGILDLFQELHDAGQTLVVVTHNPAVAQRADRIVQLDHGRLVASQATPSREEELLAALWLAEAEDGEPPRLRARDVESARALGFLAADEPVALSDFGREAAADVVRRQRLAEVLLVATLEDVELPPCGTLHPLAAGATGDVCRFLSHPNRCPHGRPIPELPGCCAQARAEQLELVH